MFNHRIIFCGLVFLIFDASRSLASEEITISHFQKQARYEFGLTLLNLALSKSDVRYKIVGVGEDINEARGEFMVVNGDLDVEFLSTTAEREAKMIPIKIPLYRGILGLRLLLVKKSNQEKMKGIRNIDDLRKYTGGHGTHWADLPVYEANKLRVVTNVDYELLFKQLIAERFEYFHRGLNEIWDEVERYSKDLTIADNVMLFYGHPIYFFVSKKRPELAKLIEKGLKKALEDGSFKKAFLEKHGEYIRLGNLKSRTLINLHNPVIPLDTAQIDTSWWLEKRK